MHSVLLYHQPIRHGALPLQGRGWCAGPGQSMCSSVRCMRDSYLFRANRRLVRKKGMRGRYSGLEGPRYFFPGGASESFRHDGATEPLLEEADSVPIASGLAVPDVGRGVIVLRTELPVAVAWYATAT